MSQDNRFPIRSHPQPAFLPRPLVMPMISHRPDMKVPPIFYYNLDDPKAEKKWRSPKEDITDYFNYGLTEETWKILADKIVKVADKVEKVTYDHGECVALNDRVPLEFGGFGAPYFDQVKKLPFLNILKKNKERFLYQYFQQSRYDIDEVKNQLQSALTSDQIEENYYQVRSAYDPLVPDLLQLKHKLPQITHTTFYRPHPSFNKGPGQPRTSLNPLKDPAVASITANLQKTAAANKAAETSKLNFTPENYEGALKTMLEMANQRFPHGGSDRRATESSWAEAARKKSEVSPRSSESKSRRKKDKEKKNRERSRSQKKDKKRKDRRSGSSRRSTSRHKKRKQEKERKHSKERAKDRDSPSESRHAKKKDKKSTKEKRDSSSPTPALPKSDIRQRIQPRAAK